ncbi:MAG: hypothetical protein GYA17_17750 [Chloroflexi bacterium]|jgi:hypothetical protein|nr:hypothetical protein [Anaerolineaceae bacterium]NMB90207.1 hypothetical protein [Chloroflexota bacterium]
MDFLTRSLTQVKWEQSQCRAEEGIFFGNNRALLLGKIEDDPDHFHYEVCQHTSLPVLMTAQPQDWAELMECAGCRIEQDGMLVTAGQGNGEGDGYIAVSRKDDNWLVWLIHINDAEDMIELSVEGKTIHALSQHYPIAYEWTIAIDDPESIRAERVRM